MSQILKLKRGSLEKLSTITGSLQKGEVIFASGSSQILSSNGTSILFVTTESGSIQAANRIMRTTGSTAPQLTSSIYNGIIDGVPYYASGSQTLFLLGSSGNEAIDLTGNIGKFSASVATSFSASVASVTSLSSSVATSFSASVASVTSLSSSVATSFSASVASVTSLSSSVSGTINNLSSSIASALDNIEIYFPIGVISSSAQVIAIFNANFTSGSTMATTVDTTFATDAELFITSSVADGGEW